MLTCTKCGNSADQADLVCLVCGGFLAGKGKTELTVGGGAKEADFFAVTHESQRLQVGAPPQPSPRSWRPIFSRLALTVFYVVFVLAVAVAVNWMLRKL